MAAKSAKKKSGSEKRKRRGRIDFRVSEREEAAIDAAALRAGLTPGAYARAKSLRKTETRAKHRPAIDTKALAQITGQLGKAFSNLNQIAKRLNIDEHSKISDLPDVLVEVKKTSRMVQDVLTWKARP